MMGICVIFNPAAKGGKARRFRQRLRQFAGDCALKPTTAPGGARELATRTVQEGFECVVAAGGDGTLNEVINGIADAPGGFERVCLGVLPVGTVNVFARELGLPLNLRGAWDIILHGHARRIDVGRAEYFAGGKPATRYFVQMGGAGLDARAVERVESSLRMRRGVMAYLRAGCRSLREAQPSITAVGDRAQEIGQAVLWGNGRYYAGPFGMFPRASLGDGLLDIRVFPRVNWPTVLRCLWGMATGQLCSAGRARHFQAASVGLTASVRTPVQLDGEWVGELPAQVSIIPGALRVIAPAPPDAGLAAPGRCR